MASTGRSSWQGKAMRMLPISLPFICAQQRKCWRSLPISGADGPEVVIDNPPDRRCHRRYRPIPDGLHPPYVPEVEERIREMAWRQVRELYGSRPPELVTARLERELDAICDNGYASLYLIAHRLVQKSLSDGYLVGSRGSVGSSLVATLCGITEVNPLPPHYLCPSASIAILSPAGK